MELIRLNPDLLARIRPAEFFLRECIPHILVVTDMSFSPASGFSLSQFVDSLLAGQVMGRTPKISKANTGIDSSADIENFTFDHASHGLKKSRYDVCFIFAFASGNQITPSELEAITEFMQDGGGMFATGDHSVLGEGICKDIPRVRAMRKWTLAQGVPSQGGPDRLSTNLPGADITYTFHDQSDIYPQRLYLNWRTGAGGIGMPHPLLQASGGGAIDYIPDHPHEGECLIPSDLTTTFSLNGGNLDEWPVEVGGASRVSPEVVAKSMSHGDSFPGKQALEPREFIAISAYDGHRCDVGRVVTDATWHHFININIDGVGSSPPREGLMPGGVDTPEMVLIREHWVNLANWLMPEIRRRCFIVLWLTAELQRYPLREELALPPLKERTPGTDIDIGRQVHYALSQHFRPFQLRELLDDLVELGLSDRKKMLKLRSSGEAFGEMSSEYMGLAALGATVAKLVDYAQERPLDKMEKADLEQLLGQSTADSIKRRASELTKRVEPGMKLLLELSQ